ncbi:hypothetical protein BGZ73_002883 [Actinomortierella ambigua]|nr:hypothetical protein BGZ73_002883 [Actinomortierella ambigua]
MAMTLEQSPSIDTRPISEEMDLQQPPLPKAVDALCPSSSSGADAAASSLSSSSSSSPACLQHPHNSSENVDISSPHPHHTSDQSAALVAAAHDKIHLASNVSAVASTTSDHDSSNTDIIPNAAASSLPSPLSPPLSISPPKNSAAMNMMSSTAALPPIHPNGAFSPHFNSHLSPRRLSTNDSSMFALHQYQQHAHALTSPSSRDTLPPLNTSFSPRTNVRGGHAHTSSISSTISAASLSSASHPVSPIYTQSPTQGDFSGAFSSNNDDSGDEIDLNVRPSVLRASLMARARVSTARSRLSTQSTQSVQSTQSMFEPRHTARSSISSAGWTSPGPRARSASIGSVCSNDSVDLDAIIASGSEINDDDQLDLAAMDDDPEWNAKDLRKTDRATNGAELYPGDHHAEPTESAQQQQQDSSVQPHHHAQDEDWQEHEETAGEFEDRRDDFEHTLDPQSPGRASKTPQGTLSPNGHASPESNRRSGRNPFDLETDFMDEQPVEGLVDVRQIQASRLRPAGQLQAPRQLVRPSAHGTGAGAGAGAGVSRLAPPRAGSTGAATAAKSGLAPPRASGLARPTAAGTQSASAKAPGSGVSRLAPPAALRPGRYATPGAGAGAGSGIKAPGATTGLRKPTAAGGAGGSGIKAPVARTNTGLAKPTAAAGTGIKPPGTATGLKAPAAGIPRPGGRTGTANGPSASATTAKSGIAAPSAIKRPSALQPPGSIHATKATSNTNPQSRLRPVSTMGVPSAAANGKGSTTPLGNSALPGGLRSPGRSTTHSNLVRPVSMIMSPSSSSSSSSSSMTSGITSPRQLTKASTFHSHYGAPSRTVIGRDGRRSAEPSSSMMHDDIYLDEHGYHGGDEEGHEGMADDDYAILTPPQSPHSSRAGGAGVLRASLLPSPSSGIPKPGASRIGGGSKIGTISRLPTIGSGLTSPRAGTSRYG